MNKKIPLVVSESGFPQPPPEARLGLSKPAYEAEKGTFSYGHSDVSQALEKGTEIDIYKYSCAARTLNIHKCYRSSRLGINTKTPTSNIAEHDDIPPDPNNCKD